jgi:hypothetical protein
MKHPCSLVFSIFTWTTWTTWTKHCGAALFGGPGKKSYPDHLDRVQKVIVSYQAAMNALSGKQMQDALRRSVWRKASKLLHHPVARSGNGSFLRGV